MEIIIDVFFGILALCCFMCLFRISRGPTAPDRTVAIDILGIVVVGFCALMAVLTGKDFYMLIFDIQPALQDYHGVAMLKQQWNVMRLEAVKWIFSLEKNSGKSIFKGIKPELIIGK